MENALAAGLAIALLAATPAPSPMPSPTASSTPAPSTLKLLWSLVGKPATALTIVPIGGTPRPLVANDKPTVVVGFASWCPGCIDELPRTMADYLKFKDRVDFVWIDYDDAIAEGDAVAAKFGIPGPIAREGDVRRSSQLSDIASHDSVILLTGITPKELPALGDQAQRDLGPEAYQRVVSLTSACAKLSEADCIALAKTQRILLGSEQSVREAAQQKPPTGAETNSLLAKASLALPVTFVIDANGIVAERLVGYDSSSDDLAKALAKLGIR